MALRYERDLLLDPAQVAQLYESAGMRRPIRDLERIAKMLKHANLVWTAWEGERLVGIARCLTDFAWTCYLADLAVARDLQHRGVGRGLVEHVRETIGPSTALVLNSAPEALAYYPKIGFTPLETAFHIPRRHPS
jgi:ribosomal protein S18 acetylase RimI-like enzyme